MYLAFVKVKRRRKKKYQKDDKNMIKNINMKIRDIVTIFIRLNEDERNNIKKMIRI